jgi:hypothetical protein
MNPTSSYVHTDSYNNSISEKNDQMAVVSDNSSPTDPNYVLEMMEQLGDAAMIIFQFLSLHDIITVGMVSKHWFLSTTANCKLHINLIIISDNEIWRPVYERRATKQFFTKLLQEPKNQKAIMKILDSNANNNYKIATIELHRMALQVLPKELKGITFSSPLLQSILQYIPFDRPDYQPYGIPKSLYDVLKKQNKPLAYTHDMKIVFVGDSCVGKTCMLYRFVYRTFPSGKFIFQLVFYYNG